jgi:hypothetical protein
MKLLKIIATNEVITGDAFDENIHLDYSNSIYHWYHFGVNLTDFVYARKRIKDIVAEVGYDNVKHKDIVNKLCVADMNDIIAYYMNEEGLSQLEATQKYLDNRADGIIKAGQCYSKRLESKEVIATIMLFIGRSQGLSLLDAVRNFKEDLRTVGLLGTQYGNDRDGIMDYFESTGSYEDSGIKSYTISDDMINAYGDEETARQEFVKKLHFLVIDKFE